MEVLWIKNEFLR